MAGGLNKKDSNKILLCKQDLKEIHTYTGTYLVLKKEALSSRVNLLSFSQVVHKAIKKKLENELLDGMALGNI